MSRIKLSEIRDLEEQLKGADPKQSARLTVKLVRMKEKFFRQ